MTIRAALFMVAWSAIAQAQTRVDYPTQLKNRPFISAADAPYSADSTGVKDASVAINAAISASPIGGTVYLPAGTYKVSTATLQVLSGVCLSGSSNGGTILNGTGSFPPVTIRNAINACVSNLEIRSINDGLLIRSDAAPDTFNPIVSNVNITAYGDGLAGIHLQAPNPLFWPTFNSVTIANAHFIVGTRTCILLEGGGSSIVRPVFNQPVIESCKFGIHAAQSSEDHLVLHDAEFDDILADTQVISVGTSAQPPVFTVPVAPNTGQNVTLRGFGTGWTGLNGNVYVATKLSSTTFSVASVWTITYCQNGSPTICYVPIAPATGQSVTVANMGTGWTGLNGVRTATNINGTTFSIPVDSSGFSGAFPGATGHPTVSVPVDASAFPSFPGVGGTPSVANSGIALWIENGNNDAEIWPRFEEEGDGLNSDKTIQLDYNAFGNQIFLDGGFSGNPSQVTDAGTGNAIFNGNGSQGLVNYFHGPQRFGNVTIDPPDTLSIPGMTSQELSVGGSLTAVQLINIPSLVTIQSGAFGLGLTLRGDSQGRTVLMTSHDFDGTATGQDCAFGPTGITGCESNGHTLGAPIVLGGTLPGTTSGVRIPAIPVGTLDACSDAIEGTHKSVTDANSGTFGAPVVNGGTHHIDAYCSGTSGGWVVH